MICTAVQMLALRQHLPVFQRRSGRLPYSRFGRRPWEYDCCKEGQSAETRKNQVQAYETMARFDIGNQWNRRRTGAER